VLSVFAAAGRGEREGVIAALDRAEEALSGLGLGAELGPLSWALDPEAGLPGEGELGAFLSGRVDTPPGPLAGPLQIARTGETTGAVRVLAGPDRSPRRVLGIGLGLLPSPAVELGREATRQHRREAMLAVLALAGPDGLDVDELFRIVWGFSFVPHLHQGVLDVALHRVRGSLRDAAELVRDEGRVALVPRRLFAVTDPRVEKMIDDRVLALLSGRATARARELAGELDVPLRTVQAALARLEEAGACVREGEGPKVSYRVEDTTFREPTRPR
jgi:hypothetical protein